LGGSTEIVGVGSKTGIGGESGAGLDQGYGGQEKKEQKKAHEIIIY